MKKKPEEWAELQGIVILDPDGWRKPNEKDFDEPITLDEFNERRMTSTIEGVKFPKASAAPCHFESDHDYEGAVFITAGVYECPKCGKDISKELKAYMESHFRDKKPYDR